MRSLQHHFISLHPERPCAVLPEATQRGSVARSPTDSSTSTLRLISVMGRIHQNVHLSRSAGNGCATVVVQLQAGERVTVAPRRAWPPNSSGGGFIQASPRAQPWRRAAIGWPTASAWHRRSAGAGSGEYITPLAPAPFPPSPPEPPFLQHSNTFPPSIPFSVLLSDTLP
ncbi:hypothetical protein CALCODRAFT_362556 [Calocera cornea HHB12733]|uniref:Uncharacterized protein n=1 Tax=Calocera cornea HHB12733 TaxID=1353952 RepID=A0A165EK51_9BASI|nr:hypothetical protein CALCODRAFT_362556 [Calocera cornea HHB12733]